MSSHQYASTVYWNQMKWMATENSVCFLVPTMEADAFRNMMAVTNIRPTGSVDACLDPPAFGSASMEARRLRVRQQPRV
jgi:hypothetical protein